MPHISKRRKAFASKVNHDKPYAALDAMKLVKETSTAKFDEAVDVAMNLGIDAKKGEQTVRGSVVLPAGTGKKVRLAVFASGDKAQAAKDAGADLVGMEDLEQVKAARPTSRRRHRGAGCDAHRRPARPDSRPARPDAQPVKRTATSR
jgi:large subunit ribosomal protein L1